MINEANLNYCRDDLGDTTSGAKVNQQRWTDGWTALHLAAMLGAEATARRLLEAGASTSLGDPANTAASFGFPAVAALCRAAPARRFRRERQIRRPEPGEAAAGDTGEDGEGGSLLGNITEVIERRRLERLEAKRRRLQEEAGGAEDRCSVGAEAGQDRRRRRSRYRGQGEDDSEARVEAVNDSAEAVKASMEGSVEAVEAAPPRSRLATLTRILVAGAVSGVVLRYLVIE